jgi:2',3'-cyclic-nucleotide 2'-phosphodiesterase (5'-nucleotidase family)
MRAIQFLLLLLSWCVPLTNSSNINIQLPLNDINILVVTDVHAWVASRKRHEPQWNADYGHVLSFYERLQKEWEDQNLFFVMNGDFIDGTGLSTYPPSHFLKKMPWDALNIGNHELYTNATIEHIIQGGFAEYWGTKYVTSNVLRADDGKALGPLGGARHLVLHGPSAKVLVFGFLYDMTDSSPLVIVEPVEQVVEQKWFTAALTGDYHAIVCLVHMDVKDPLVSVILRKIRSVVGDAIPVQFISGHSHIRAFDQVDQRSTSFEAGHYLDTIGFVSFDKNGTNFQHIFIEANVDALQSIIGVDDIMTENGTMVQNMIHAAQEEMGLLDTIGCSPDHFQFDVELSNPQSLWRVFMDNVINGFYFDGSKKSIYIQSSGSFRYDLYQGQVNQDDILSVNPFNDTIFRVSNDLKGTQIIHVLGGRINSLEDSLPWLPSLPAYICSMDVIDPDGTYELFTAEANLLHFIQRVENITGKLVYPESQHIGTADLWIDFVSQKWRNERNCQPNTNIILIVGIGLAFSTVVIAVTVFVVRRRRTLAGYDIATVATGQCSANEINDDYTDELI